MNMSIGGLDIGSTGAKLTVLDEKGAVLHSGYQAYPYRGARLPTNCTLTMYGTLPVPC